MRKTIELIEMSELVNAVVKTVFITDETTGQIDYRPEYVEVVKAFFKMKFYAPDEIIDYNDNIENFNIEDFYIDWVNGKYIETLNNIDMAQNNNIDKAITEKIEYVKAQVGNPLNNALASLINIIQDGIDIFTSSFGNLSADDIKNVMVQANNIVEGLDKNAKNVVKAVAENVVEKTENTQKTNMQAKRNNSKTGAKNKSKAIAIPAIDNMGETNTDGKQ